jgi:hypothetical protein
VDSFLKPFRGAYPIEDAFVLSSRLLTTEAMNATVVPKRAWEELRAAREASRVQSVR